MTQKSIYKNSFGTLRELTLSKANVKFFKLDKLGEQGLPDITRFPLSIKILLESVLRGEDGKYITPDDIANLAAYDPRALKPIEIPYKPSRVLLQDFTGVPAVVDLAAMRSAMVRLGGDPSLVNPRIPVDLVVDHSVQVDVFGRGDALVQNARLEFERNRERYELLHWAGRSFSNFRVIPPASGICHQVNLEYLAKVVQLGGAETGGVAFPDSVVGTDSHTTMIGGLGILGFGVGGIEAEAVMLGQPLYMLAPEVVGVKLEGRLPEGSTATDLVLAITELLRKHNVVGKFVEFYGSGLSSLTVADRATVSNMAPEYGATVGYFPVDELTLAYLRDTGRPEELVELIERYTKEQGLFRLDATDSPVFTETVGLDLGQVKPCLAGPKRPQDRIGLFDMKTAWAKSLTSSYEKGGFGIEGSAVKDSVEIEFPDSGVFPLNHGSVAIAAITSCTNTSNPNVMLAAGLVAKKAVDRGLSVKPWVKTSLAPGSAVVTEYLQNTGLLSPLEALGFHVVGYGCTTCIGNSGPLPAPVSKAVRENKLVVAGVLSGNRNFEGRINPDVMANYLASPPLVVVYALAGTVDINLEVEPIGTNEQGDPVYLKDVWPTPEELSEVSRGALSPEMFTDKYSNIERSNPEWNRIEAEDEPIYQWDKESTYIQEPPFFEKLSLEDKTIESIKAARVLVMVGDSVTTDHISPAGSIPVNGPAGRYLTEHGVNEDAYNSFGSRRGNDRVMTRGTFANIRLRNQLAPGTEGGYSTYLPTGEVMSVFEAAEKYKAAGTPTIVLAGKNYGMGSSRDWAAKGALLLGVRAVIAESFERIHRSNLVGMGVLPLEFEPGQSVSNLGIQGNERFEITLRENLLPKQKLEIMVENESGKKWTFRAICRIDSSVEVDYYRNGGILPTVIKGFFER
jgi:aconitate hydratase